jgi:hypothetical protein
MEQHITFKKATLTVESEKIEGIMIYPSKIFVPAGFPTEDNEPTYFSHNYERCEKLFADCIEQGSPELYTALGLSIFFIDYYFFDKNSGYIINFYQPDQTFESNVYVAVYEFEEFFYGCSMVDELKNKALQTLLNTNPSEEIKNRILAMAL